MNTTPNGHGLGFRRALGDIRNYALSVSVGAIAVPQAVDLSISPSMPPVGDQGNLGSCTAWASTAAYRYEARMQGLPDFEPSELAQYYWTRALEGTTHHDDGGTITDAIKALAKYGAAPESLWPYDVARFAHVPSAAARAAAKKHLAIRYEKVPQNENAICAVLAAGYPIVFGISVYDSFEADSTLAHGMVPMPSNTEQLLGGHAICMVGYDKKTRHKKIRNSWGTGIGDNGYMYLPDEYVLNGELASDLWIIKQAS